MPNATLIKSSKYDKGGFTSQSSTFLVGLLGLKVEPGNELSAKDFLLHAIRHHVPHV